MKAWHKKKRTLKLFSWRTVLLTVAAVVLGVSIYSWNAENLVGDKMPMPFGYGASVVLSGSMEPRLSVDDLIIIRKTQDVQVDDIVVFQEGRSLVIHRIIEMDGDRIITKGDANNMADAPITRTAIKGVLVADIPHVGIVVDVLRQPAVVLLLLGAALLLANQSMRQGKQAGSKELDAMRREIESLKRDMDDLT